MYLFIFYLFVAIEWTFPRFILKQLTDYFNTIEIMVLVHLAWHLFMLLFFSYIWIFKNKNGANLIGLNSNKKFDEKFIDLARSVYITNDKRSEIKLDINNLFGCIFILFGVLFSQLAPILKKINYK